MDGDSFLSQDLLQQPDVVNGEATAATTTPGPTQSPQPREPAGESRVLFPLNRAKQLESAPPSSSGWEEYRDAPWKSSRIQKWAQKECLRVMEN